MNCWYNCRIMLNRKLKISAAAAVFVGASLALTSAATQDPATNAASAKPANRMTELFGDAVLAKGKGVEV